MTTPDVLLAVDAALASGRPDATDPLERELQELALALRADAPAPDPDFARALDRRVAARFARPRPGRLPRPRPRLVLAGAAALCVAVGVGGAVVGLTGGHRASRSAADLSFRTQARSEPPAVRRPAPGLVPSAASRTLAMKASSRRVERTARLTLAAPAGRLDDVATRVVRVTDRHHGLVVDSSLATGSDPSRGGSFTLRVPSRELPGTLRDLSRLAQVRSRGESGRDVTHGYTGLRGRLAIARTERAKLRRELARARYGRQAGELRLRIATLTRTIRLTRDRLGHLETRTDYTRVAVTLVEQRRAAGVLGGAGKALRGSLRALVGALAVTLRVIAAVLPFALLVALAWAAAAAIRRRRREAVLS